VTALDKFISDFVSQKDEKMAIRFPECPRCRQQIRRCTRYMPIINQVHNLIEQVKKKILGNQSDKQIEERRRQLVNEFERTETRLRQIDLGQVKNFFSKLYDPDNLFSDDILILMNNILLFINEIERLLIEGRKKLPFNTFEDLVSVSISSYHYLFSF
jgi:hypothetical protein